jgi:hypothetical protein
LFHKYFFDFESFGGMIVIVAMLGIFALTRTNLFHNFPLVGTLNTETQKGSSNPFINVYFYKLTNSPQNKELRYRRKTSFLISKLF